MRTVITFVGFILFGLILFFLIGDALVDESWFDQVGAWAWLVAIGLLIADILFPIPTTLIITVMGQKYGPVLGGVIGTAGTCLAGLIAYGLTRMLGIRFARWLLADELGTAEKFFFTNGSFAVACSRWLPLFPEAISTMAGLARMPFRKYCVALICGSLPMSFAYATLATISENEIIPLVISILLPVPIWWVAGRLLRLRVKDVKN